MTVQDLLRQAQAAGLRVTAQGDRLQIKGPPAAKEWALRLLAEKEAVLAALRESSLAQGGGVDETPKILEKEGGFVDGGGPVEPDSGSSDSPTSEDSPAHRQARDAWRKAVKQVADAWEAAARDCRQRDQEPPWLHETDDDRLQALVRARILASDLPGAIEAIESWKAAWLGMLGMSTVQLATLSKSEGRKLARHLRSFPPLRLIEILEATGIGDDVKDLCRKEFDARIERILAESDGRRPPPNASVHEMFREFRARVGSRDIEESSMTIWLRKHAPEVAALWAEAPVTASWLEWRERVGREHMATLDEAWRSALKLKACPWQEGTP